MKLAVAWVNNSEPETEFQETVNQSKAIHPPQSSATEDGCSNPWRWRRRLGRSKQRKFDLIVRFLLKAATAPHKLFLKLCV